MNRQIFGSVLTIATVMLFGAACDAKCTFDVKREPPDAASVEWMPVDI